MSGAGEPFVRQAVSLEENRREGKGGVRAYEAGIALHPKRSALTGALESSVSRGSSGTVLPGQSQKVPGGAGTEGRADGSAHGLHEGRDGSGGYPVATAAEARVEPESEQEVLRQLERERAMQQEVLNRLLRSHGDATAGGAAQPSEEGSPMDLAIPSQRSSVPSGREEESREGQGQQVVNRAASSLEETPSLDAVVEEPDEYVLAPNPPSSCP